MISFCYSSQFYCTNFVSFTFFVAFRPNKPYFLRPVMVFARESVMLCVEFNIYVSFLILQIEDS